MRLIDADAFKENFPATHRTGFCADSFLWEKDSICAVVDGAPTIETPKWISVKDRVPEYSCEVITYDAKKDVVQTLGYSKKWGKFNASDCLDHCNNAIDVTHWMPIPDLPED